MVYGFPSEMVSLGKIFKPNAGEKVWPANGTGIKQFENPA